MPRQSFLALVLAGIALPAAHAFDDGPAVPGPGGPAAHRPRTPPEHFAAVAKPLWEDPLAPVAASTGDLITAARSGDLDRVRALLATGAPANGADEQGERPLLAAVAAGHGEVLRVLLRAGANPDVKGPQGRTALGLAAAAGYTDLAGQLVRAGAQIRLRSADGSAAIHEAARFDRSPIIRLLLATDPDCLQAPDRQGLPPLAVAARAGSLDAMATLLGAGAAVDAPDHKGHTPLYWAIYDQQATAEAFLLERGASYRRLQWPTFD